MRDVRDRAPLSSTRGSLGSLRRSEGASERSAFAFGCCVQGGASGDAFSDEKLEALFRSMEAKFKAEMGLVDAEGEGEAAEGGY